MSPMWADSHASRPSARQKVFFRSAPTASDGRASNGRRQRHRRVAPRAAHGQLDAVDGTDHGVVAGTWIGRSWVSQASASPASRVERLGVVGDDRLAGQVAARHHQHLGTAGPPAVRAAGGAPACRATSRRGRRLPGAPRRPTSPVRRRARTIGRRVTR